MRVQDVGRALLSDIPTLSDDELMLCIDLLSLALLDDDIAPAQALLWAALAESSVREQRRSHCGRVAVGGTLQRGTKH